MHPHSRGAWSRAAGEELSEMRRNLGPGTRATAGTGTTGRRDLVMLALPGVRRFLADSPTPRDLRSASVIVARLAARAATVFGDHPGADLITPGGRDWEGMPSTIIVLLPEGAGPAVARQACQAIDSEWAGMLHAALGLAPDTAAAPVPGFPQAHWVCVPSSGTGYRAQLDQAIAEMDARGRVHDFPGFTREGRDVCQLSPRWPAERAAPPAAAGRERAERLSAPNWAKRVLPRIDSDPAARAVDRFPSAASLASAPFRRDVLAMLGLPEVAAAAAALREAAAALGDPGEDPVPGLPGASGGLAAWIRSSAGPWVYPDSWQPRLLARGLGGRRAGDGMLATIAAVGQEAVIRLQKAMAATAGTPGPSRYLALLLGDQPRAVYPREAAGTPSSHKRAAARLRAAEAGQRAIFLESGGPLGVTVYAGGGSLVAFTAASSALSAARLIREASAAGAPPARTAVFFFHHRAELPSVLAAGYELLTHAGDDAPGVDVLSIGAARRQGGITWSVQPWSAVPKNCPEGGNEDDSAAALLEVLARRREGVMSPRLAAALDRDAAALSAIGSPRLLAAEIRRLTRVHGGAAADAEVLARLSFAELSPDGGRRDAPARAAVVIAQLAAFLSREYQ